MQQNLYLYYINALLILPTNNFPHIFDLEFVASKEFVNHTACIVS